MTGGPKVRAVTGNAVVHRVYEEPCLSQVHRSGPDAETHHQRPAPLAAPLALPLPALVEPGICGSWLPAHAQAPQAWPWAPVRPHARN